MQNINPTVDGVLGGYELVNDMDVKESSIFIEEMCRGMFASVSNQGLCALGTFYFYEFSFQKKNDFFLQTVGLELDESLKICCPSTFLK